jgi:hypothetical protein
MRPLHLTEKQFNELMRLSRLYRRQARRCADANAHLAACVMIGAALESDLMAFCHCYAEEVPLDAIPQRRAEPKHLLDWTLAELLRVAKKCGWLETELRVDEAWDPRRAEIGDWAEIVRQVRNLVHPARYLSDFAGRRITKKRRELCSDVLDAAQDQLLAKLHKSLEAAVLKLERKSQAKATTRRRSPKVNDTRRGNGRG